MSAMPVIWADKMGIPGVVLAATTFLPLVINIGEQYELRGLRSAHYTGSWLLDSDEDTRKIYEDITLEEAVKGLTEDKEPPPILIDPDIQPRDIVFTGTISEVNEFFKENRWSDGGAIIPPTIERVEEFLKYTDLPEDELIGIMPVGYHRLTPWYVAVNAVMAGCRPEYMPVLIAIAQGHMKDSFNPANIGSTGTYVPYCIINGPIYRQLNIEAEQGNISAEPNFAIARWWALLIRNVGDYRTNINYMGTFGYPLPFIFAEDELNNPWGPLHVTRAGLDKNDNAVTIAGAWSYLRQSFPGGTNADEILGMIAYDAVTSGPLLSPLDQDWHTPKTILMTAPVARVIANNGYTLQEMKEFLAANAKMSVEEAAIRATGTGDGPSWETALEMAKDAASDTGTTFRPDATVGNLSPDNFEIIVCGDPSRNKQTTLSGVFAYSQLETTQIQLPANWDNLMADLGYAPLSDFSL